MNKAVRQERIARNASQMVQWTVARHNFIVDNKSGSMDPESLLAELMRQKDQIREILFEAGENGELNDVLGRALGELNTLKDELHVIDEEQARILDAETWTPDDGVLPEPFDITLGEGENKKRYVSLGEGLWTNVPLDLTQQHLQQLRDRVKERAKQEGGEEEATAPSMDQGEALSHAQRCLLEAAGLHLTRFAMATAQEERDSSPLNRIAHDKKPVSHELMGIVVSGNTEVAAFSSPNFMKMIGQYLEVDPAGIRFVGATQLRNAFPLIISSQGMFDLSKTIAGRLENGLDAIGDNDPRIQEHRQQLGLSSAEMFEDVEDYSLLVYSVVRQDMETHGMWVRGGVDLIQEQNDDDHASWVMLAEAWLDRHHVMGTYILPPCHVFEAVCRLAASFLAGIGQGQSSTVAALGQEGSINAQDLIDVVAFDDNDIPQARSQVPAWTFGLTENSVGQQLDELFSIELTVLPSEHGLDLEEIPLVNSIEEDTLALMEEHIAKRTLH